MTGQVFGHYLHKLLCLRDGVVVTVLDLLHVGEYQHYGVLNSLNRVSRKQLLHWEVFHDDVSRLTGL